jgi:hypothetical protein
MVDVEEVEFDMDDKGKTSRRSSKTVKEAKDRGIIA